MNKTYRKVWSAKQGAYVAVSEVARSRGKCGGLVAAVALCAGLGSGGVWAQLTTNWATWTLPSGAAYNQTLVGTAFSGSYATSITGSVLDPLNSNNAVGITVTGEILNQSTSSFTWSTYGTAPSVGSITRAQTYDSSHANGLSGSTATYMLTQTGYTDPAHKAHTATFSQAVSDVVMSIYSLGGDNTASTLVFSQPFEILSSNGQAVAGNGSSRFASGGNAQTGYYLTGYEGNGVIQFLGSYTSISWDVTAPEYYSGFNFGMSNTPYSGYGTVTPSTQTFPLPQGFSMNRPINDSADTVGGLDSVTTRVFDGGTLNITASQNPTLSGTGFTVKNSGGYIKIAAGSVDFVAPIANEGTETTGNLTKQGAGTLVVKGSKTFTGTLTVAEGVVDLNGSTAANVVVQSGGTLKGSGTASADVTVAGKVAPGNSPGTLTVVGDFTMNAGSTFEAEIDGRTYDAAGGAGTYDRIAITGATSVFTADGEIAPILRGISAPANNDFTPVIGDAFRVVTTANANGVDATGAFATVTDPTDGMPANSRFDVIYGANYIDLVLTPDSLETFAQGYGIQNMVNAGRAFDGIRPAQGTRGTSDTHQFFNGLYGLAAAPLATTLLQASGEIHAFALAETRQGWQASHQLVGAAAGVKAERNVWIDVAGQSARYKQDGYASAYDSDNTHLWVGTHLLERRDSHLGVAAGVSRRKVNTHQTGSAKVETHALAVYALGRKDAFDYSAVFSLNRSGLDTARQTGLSTGAVGNTSDSTVDGAVLSVSAGFKHALNERVNGRVWVSGLVDQTRAAAFTEAGSTVTALGVAKETFKSAQASLGYTFSGDVRGTENRNGTWQLGLGVSRQFDQGRDQVARQMSLHGASWQVTTPKVGAVTRFVQAGVRMPVAANADAWISLGASRREGATARGGNVGLSVRW